MTFDTDVFTKMTRALMANVKRAAFSPLYKLPVEQARASYQAGVGAMEGPRAVLPRVQDFTIPGPAGAISARLWAPSTEARLPVLLYFHGGGFVVGSIDTCEGMCRQVALQSGAAVIAIDYRLAPEHKFPAQIEDCFAALRWLADHGHGLGLDTRRIAVGGDSAGGSLAATAALMARDADIPLRLQALFYPSVQTSLTTESHKRYAHGTMLDSHLMSWFEAHLQAQGVEPAWLREPLNAPSHAGVAPAWIGLAVCDTLADDGPLYAEALRKSGVPATVRVWNGVLHGFINMGRFIPEAAQAHAELAGAVRQAFAV